MADGRGPVSRAAPGRYIMAGAHTVLLMMCWWRRPAISEPRQVKICAVKE